MIRNKGETVTAEKKDAYQVRMDGALRGAEQAITNAYARGGGDWMRSDYIKGVQDFAATVRTILGIPDPENDPNAKPMVVVDTGYNTGINPDQPFIPPVGTAIHEPIIAQADANGNPIPSTIRDFYGPAGTNAQGELIAIGIGPEAYA